VYCNLCRDLERYCDSLGYGSTPGWFGKLYVIFKSPGYWAVVHYRFGFWVNKHYGESYRNPLKILLKMLYFAAKQVIVCLTKIDIMVTSDIGPGLFLSNKGNIIMGLRRMGKDCTIHHNVTIGQGVEGISPNFGDNIWLGHDSVVYGVIGIGDNTIIHDHTVLSKSLPGNIIAGGNPCRIKKRNIDPEHYSTMHAECLP